MTPLRNLLINQIVVVHEKDEKKIFDLMPLGNRSRDICMSTADVSKNCATTTTVHFVGHFFLPSIKSSNILLLMRW